MFNDEIQTPNQTVLYVHCILLTIQIIYDKLCHNDDSFLSNGVESSQIRMCLSPTINLA